MKKYYFASIALMAILVTSIGGQQQAFAIMGADALPSGGSIDLYEILDGSGSISSGDFTLQTAGLVSALNTAVQPADFGKLRITVILFSTGSSVVCGPTAIVDANALATLNACITALVQPGGLTCIECAYIDVITELGISPLTGADDRSIVDLVTDGFPQDPIQTAIEVGNAIAAGLDSNIALGVGAGSNNPFLATLTHPGVSPGPIDPVPLPDPLVQGFVVTAANFAAFEAAMTEKLGGIVGVVGGELLSINTTALILAGAQTNAVWIMSALAVIGSVAFGALYITSKKN